jgi:dolichol kinase
MVNPSLALLASFAYVFAMLGIAEGLRAWRGYTTDFTRKFIHVSVGMWSYGTVLLFERRTFAVIPPLCFVALNAFSYWRGTFKAMETGQKNQLGTVYFPIAFAALIWLFWGRPHVLVASLMPMTWGDATAAVVGRRHGRRLYQILGSTRSVEGSVASLPISWLATWIPLVILAPHNPAPLRMAGVAGLVALGATAVEALSPWGLDNLTVPAAAALLLAGLLP